MRFVSFSCLLVLLSACSTDTFGPADSSTTDSPTVGDGDVGGDAQPPPCNDSFCATNGAAALCADFDEGSSWMSNFTITTGGSGSITTTTTHAEACSSLEAKLDTISLDASTTTSRAIASHTFQLNPTNAEVKVDVEMFLPAPTTPVTAFAIRANTETDSGVTIESDAAGWSLAIRRGGGQSPETHALVIQPGTWTHMSFDVKLGMNGSASTSLAYNTDGGTGSKVLDTQDNSAESTVTLGKVTLGLDSALTGAVSPIVVDYDDVVVTIP